MWTGSTSPWRRWGRRLSSALLCCSSIATGAHAADQARTLSLSGALLTTTNQMVAVCDANTVLQYDQGATSGTSAGRKLVYSGGAWSVSTFSGPSPSNGYGQATYLACDATTVILGGGQDADNGGNWVYTSTVADPGTWTSRVDAAAGASQRKGFYGAGHASPPGSGSWVIGFRYQNGSIQDIAELYTYTPPATFGASFATYNSGGNNFGLECSGAWASSTHYGGACWGSSAASVVGYNGTTTIYSNSVGPISCGGLSGGTLVARQSFGAAGATNNPVFHVAHNGTNSQVCGVSWSGSTAARIADQTFSSKAIVGGAYFSSVIWVWDSTGVAYSGGGSVVSYFADESGSTYDLACDSGSLALVVLGLDVDQDGSSTDNLTGFCTSGNIVYYGEAQPSTASASPRPKGSRPFDGFPFVMPEAR